MVWSQQREADPPLSVILPQLYLGAESDVTQEQLSSLGISYVLSVSRCSPQPSFLPHSRYLRIPIDDSLWDNLLPWIPQALHFIDAAMSTGASVLVHCAAGISRSPALAVAYIMYSLGMDLDHAYRFVKERRPSISPNFNFLGQLQHFQGSLNDSVQHNQSSQNMNNQVDSADLYHTNKALHQHSLSDGANQQLSLSGKLRTLRLSLSQNQQHLQMSCEVQAPRPSEPVKAAAKPTQLRLPAGSASLLEKRKSLTLSLNPPSSASSSEQARDATLPKAVHSRNMSDRPEAEDVHREQNVPHSKEQGLLSPLSFTLNKLLGWGERLLLGGVFVQPALPYRC